MHSIESLLGYMRALNVEEIVRLHFAPHGNTAPHTLIRDYMVEAQKELEEIKAAHVDFKTAIQQLKERYDAL